MATFAQDLFADGTNTAIASHTPDVGGSWVRPSYETATIIISDANRVRANSSSAATAYNNGSPASAEYDVQADIITLSVTNGRADVAGRLDTAAQTYYLGGFNGNGDNWQLFKCVSGSFTSLGTYGDADSASRSRTVKLEIRDATKKVYVDGTERISSSDNAITAAGKAGIRFDAQNTPDNTTEHHVDNFSATDAAGATYTGSGAITLPALTVAGSGTFTAPVYSGTGAVTLPPLTVAGTGTFTAPVYSGSGALSLSPLTVSGDGTFTAPGYDGAGALSLPPLTIEGSGTFTAPVYTGVGALALPPITVAGVGIFASAVYSGSGALSLPALTLSGAGTFTVPPYTGDGAISLPSLAVDGTGTHTAPSYTGTGAVVLPALTVAGAGTLTAPTYSGSGAVGLPALSLAGVGAFTASGPAPAFIGAVAAVSRDGGVAAGVDRPLGSTSGAGLPPQ